MYSLLVKLALKNSIANYVSSEVSKSLYDNAIRDCVKPLEGSIVYCKLANTVEHSGIYVGDNKIAHLNGSGLIELVSPKTFLERLDGLNLAISIYVSCLPLDGVGDWPVGDVAIARRAIEMVGERRDYNLLFDNCHQFTSGCISGDFENSDNTLWKLKRTVEEKINANTWRVWKTNENGEYV